MVFFNAKKAEDFGYIRKRAGQLFSKSRFVAAQFQGYFDRGHWLDNAFHANTMAKRLATGIGQLSTARILWEPEANEVFAIWPKAVSARLKAAGAQFYEWNPDGLSEDEKPRDDEDLVRLVTSFATGRPRGRPLPEGARQVAARHPPDMQKGAARGAALRHSCRFTGCERSGLRSPSRNQLS